MKIRSPFLALVSVFVFALLAVTFAQKPEIPPVVAEAPMKKEGEKPAKFDEALTYKPTPIPDRIILTWSADPCTTQSVTWRTDESVTAPVAEIAPKSDAGGFTTGWKGKEKKPTAQSFIARSEKLKSDLSTALYHSVTFTDLQPESTYLYRVGDGSNWSEWMEFTTASKEAKPFSFIYFGDAQNDLKAHWSRVIRRAYRTAPYAKFMIHAGDLINRANRDAEWGEWFECGGWINGTMPSVPVPGNHEWAKEEIKPAPGDKKEEKQYRGSISNNWRPSFTLFENGPEKQKELAYWFDFQGVRFVGLNSNESKTKSEADKESQARWLEKVLAENPQRWTVLTFHHPIFSPAKKRDNASLRKAWQPIIDKYKVDLVLQGHDHTYARSSLMKADSTLSDKGETLSLGGTVYAVSVSGPKMYELNKKDWMKSSAENTQLYQVISVDGDKLHYEARTASGELYDVFELHKQADGRNKIVEKEELGLSTTRDPWWQRNALALALLFLATTTFLFVLRKQLLLG